MAKSLRSKSKRDFRTHKRTSTKSDYAVAEAARTNALSARLQAGLKKDKLPVETDADQDGDDENVDGGDQQSTKASATTATVEEEDMKDESAESAPRKVSTSGPRDSRRETWRKSRGMVPFKNKGGNKLFDAHKSKNGGRLKRRR